MPDIGVAPCEGTEPCKVSHSVAHRSSNQCHMRGKWEATLLTQLTEIFIQDSAMSINLGEHIITTTEDKVRLAFMTHLKRTSEKNAWVAPASILLSIVVVFVCLLPPTLRRLSAFQRQRGVPCS
jgi:hypothetical protein